MVANNRVQEHNRVFNALSVAANDAGYDITDATSISVVSFEGDCYSRAEARFSDGCVMAFLINYDNMDEEGGE